MLGKKIQVWHNFCNIWTDLKKIRYIAIGSLILLIATILGVVVTVFLLTVLPYGWPQKSFILHVPLKKQSQMYAVVGVAFFLPVIASWAMYAVLYCKIEIKINKVGQGM